MTISILLRLYYKPCISEEFEWSISFILIFASAQRSLLFVYYYMKTLVTHLIGKNNVNPQFIFYFMFFPHDVYSLEVFLSIIYSLIDASLDGDYVLVMIFNIYFLFNGLIVFKINIKWKILSQSGITTMKYNLTLSHFILKEFI